MNAFIDISGTMIHTPRLTLRPWRETDLADFYEYCKVDGVGQMAGWLPHENMDVSKAVLDGFIKGKADFALEYQGKVIGSLGLNAYPEDRFPQFSYLRGRVIGYVLSKDYWGQGLMPEAVQAVIDYAFSALRLDFLLVGHFHRNDRSRRVIEKCGFTYIGDGIHQTRYGTEEPVRDYIMKRGF